MVTIAEKITIFKQDLLDNKSDIDIVRKFLCFGIPHVFEGKDFEYFELKDIIAKHFGIHPNEVLIVGSGKLGFSIAPQKLWKPFDINSDIDIAIISPKIFEKYWTILRDIDIDTLPRNVKQDEDYQEFLLYLFKGWLRPDKFNSKHKISNEWFKFFKSLKSIVSENKEHDVNAGIYKNFDAFEYYHCKNINRLKNIIKENQ